MCLGRLSRGKGSLVPHASGGGRASPKSMDYDIHGGFWNGISVKSLYVLWCVQMYLTFNIDKLMLTVPGQNY